MHARRQKQNVGSRASPPTTLPAASPPWARSEIQTYAGETFQKEGIALHLGAR